MVGKDGSAASRIAIWQELTCVPGKGSLAYAFAALH